MPDPIIVVEYEPVWPGLFAAQAAELRRALGPVALRVDHIGSTAVPGLPAKPVIDVQIAVAALEPTEPFRAPLERLGYVFRPDNDDRTQRYFREAPGTRRTHIHVRRTGSFGEQLALLFRDYLRTYPEEAEGYARRKHALATRYRDDRPGYVAAKQPYIWEMLARADDWSQATGWEPEPSDT